MLLLTMAVLCLTAASLSSENRATVTGRVTDPTGAAVPGAIVTLRARDGAPQRTAVSDTDGRYRFENLPQAEYLLEAQARGLQTMQAGTVWVESDGAATRDIDLDVARVRTHVVVTASGTAQTTDETAKAFDVIDAAEIGRRAEFSIVESLRTMPGLRVSQLGGPGSFMRVHTRGLRAFDTSVLIDGFRVRDVSAPQGDATGFLGDLLVANTDRVEVLRGSGSSLYGTNAMAGVVNVVTDQGGGPLHGELLADGGGLGVARGVAKLAGGGLENRVQYSLGVTHLNVTRGVDGDDRVKNSVAQGYAQWRPAPRASISGRLMGNNAAVGLNGSASAAPLGQLGTALPVRAVEGRTFFAAPNDPDYRRESHFVAGLATITHQLTGRATLRGHYHGFATSRDNRNGPGGAGFQSAFNNANRFDGRIDTGQGRIDAWLSRRHLLSAGYEFEREDYDNLSTDENPNPASRVRAQVLVTQSSHAVFGQDQLRWLDDRLQVSLSGRLQTFRLSRPVFEGGAPRYDLVEIPSAPRALTGDAAVSYFLPQSNTKLRAHVGNAYRSPALYERFGTAFFGGTFTPYGDPRLGPERSIGMDAGIDQYLAASRLKVSATYFYTRLQQVVAFDSSGLIRSASDPFARSLGYLNTGGGLARGLELSVEANPARRLRVFSSYTYTNADDRNSTVLGGSISSIRISDHMFTSVVTASLGHGIDTTFDFMAASDYIYPLFSGGSRPFLFNGPVKGDLVLSYTRPLDDKRSVQFFGRLENLFNRVYFEDGYRTPKAWAVGGIRFTF